MKMLRNLQLLGLYFHLFSTFLIRHLSCQLLFSKLLIMKVLIFFILLLFVSFQMFGQVIPDDRHPDWKLIYANHTFREPQTIVNVQEFGAVGDGQTDDYQSIVNAIASLNGQLGTVFFPPGNYLITQTIALLDSVIIQGFSSDSTSLSFNFNGQAMDCFVISKGQANIFVPINSIGTNGNSWFTLADATSFVSGDLIELRQTNGAWDVVPIDWAANSVGHISQISQVKFDTIFLKSPFRIDFDMSLIPEVRKLDPISNVGIKCLTINRLDCPTSGAGSNMMFNFATQCEVIGVESNVSVGSHISINDCSNIFISGNYIHHACTYDGAGTRGYGVTMSQHSSECVVVNNIFRYLRHAMMVKTGSNGNIFAYNYSIESYRSETIHDFSGDISLHGHYAFANLFEGNIIQNIIIDHYWGPAGPFNTFFRNRTELYGIYMTSSTLIETDKQNIVGNEVPGPSFPYGQYVLTGTDHFQYGNNVKGNIIPAGTDNLPDSSYFLNDKPDFWTNTSTWPSIGIPNELNAQSIPARDRYLAAQLLTVCFPDTSTISIHQWANPQTNLKINPNPSNGQFQIELNDPMSKVAHLSCVSLTGVVVYESDYQIINGELKVKLDLNSNFESGLYFLIVTTDNYTICRKLSIFH